VSVWVLLIVIWQAGTSPDVEATVVKNEATCVALAMSFSEAEDIVNGANPPAFADHYVATCELKNGTEVESL
jgi:hypothetical protein